MLIEKPLAPTEEECREIAGAVERAGIVAAVAHVLRYTPYTRLAQALARRRRGGGGREHRAPRAGRLPGTRRTRTCAATGAARTRPARCCSPSAATTSTGCRYVVGEPCARGVVVRRASRTSGATAAPDGAGERCVDVRDRAGLPVLGAPALPRDGRARRDRLAGRRRGLAADARERRAGAARRPVRALRVGVRQRRGRSPGGRTCEYASGVTASLTMTAFTRMRDRETRIFGTRGELYGDGDGGRGLRLPHARRRRATRSRRRARPATAAATTA